MLLEEFFREFNVHCQLSREDKRKMRADFENAMAYLTNRGVPLAEALKRLDTKHLGGFYARPSVSWYALDDAAKIYPFSMAHGKMTVFRLSAYLKSAVSPELLQMALNFTIKRFPSFATTLKKGFFWHYLNATKRRYVIEQEEDAPCRPMPVSHSFSQSFRVLYFANRVSVEFFHGLTDGTGGMTFLKVLVSEYLRLAGATLERDETVWDANGIPQKEEVQNEFQFVPRPKNAAGFVQKNAVQMSGRLAKRNPTRMLHFKMDAARLKQAANAYGGTVTAFLLAVIMTACKAATDELTGDIGVQVPVNMRKMYPSQTVRNFSMYCSIRLPISEIGAFDALIPEIQRQLRQKTAKDVMSQMLTATEKLVLGISWIPLFIKQPLVKLVYSFLDDKLFTVTLSNLGVVKLPKGYEEYVDSLDFSLGINAVNRAACAMVTYENTATLSITKMTTDPTFEESIYDQLVKQGIEPKVEGSMAYEG